MHAHDTLYEISLLEIGLHDPHGYVAACDACSAGAGKAADPQTH
jgi:hypothetical protein